MSLKVRPRALIIALVILVAVDVVVRLAHPVTLPDDYRMPDRTLIGYDELVTSAARQDGVRIAVVGDSLVWGTLATAGDTLPAHLTDTLAERGLTARAYNFGLSGAQSAEILPVVANLVEERAADVIVIPFDYRFYSEREPVKRRYPGLYDRVSDWGPAADDPAVKLAAPTKSAAPTFEDRVSEAVGRVWALYGRRDYFAAALLGDTPKNSARAALLRFRAKQENDRPLFSKRAPQQLDATEVSKAFDVPPLDERNPHIAQLDAAIKIANERGTQVIVIGSPLDTQLLTEQNWWNRGAYADNMAWLSQHLGTQGAAFIDLTEALPSEKIGDTHHPLGPGYRAYAERLALELEPFVGSAFARREQEREAR